MDLEKNEQPRTEPPENDPESAGHLAWLGPAALQRYRAWCERHGFTRRIEKTPHDCEQERPVVARVAADARLAKRKNTDRRPDRLIEAIFAGEGSGPVERGPLFEAIELAACSPDESDGTKDAARRLFVHVSRHADLLSTAPVIAALGRRAGNNYVDAVAALSRHWKHWIRSPETWRPRTHNARRQFASLARHLFALWSVPAFLDAAWFTCNADDGLRRQGWFLHIGRGANIRHADLPIPYTKKMAHHFLGAPADLGIDAAVRWGQVHALGGDGRLVRALVGTRLEREFEHDEFWTSVLRWFITHPPSAKEQIGPMIDFIHHRKFAPTVVDDDGGLGRGEPLQPNFSMKDRTTATLLRQMAAWHGGLSRTEQRPTEWAASGIEPFRFVEGNDGEARRRIWTTRELLNSPALTNEGRAMRHCVGIYSRACASGASSIWTLEVDEQGEVRKVVTIEIELRTLTICQVRGKRNALPDARVRALLRRWATQTGLYLRGV